MVNGLEISAMLATVSSMVRTTTFAPFFWYFPLFLQYFSFWYVKIFLYSSSKFINIDMFPRADTWFSAGCYSLAFFFLCPLIYDVVALY